MRLRPSLVIVGAATAVAAAVWAAQGGLKIEQPAFLASATGSRILFADSVLTRLVPTQLVSVTVQGSAVLNPQTGYYTYSYTLASDPSSQNDVNLFALVVPSPLSISSPAHWTAFRYLYGASDSAVVWQVTDVGTLPPGYVNLQNIPPSQFDIPPGQSVGGFAFVTPVPPIAGGTQFIAQGFDTIPGGAEDWGDENPYPDVLAQGVTGLTIGPGNPVGIPDNDGAVQNELRAAHPNPSSGSVAIGFSLGRPGMVNLAIYGISGRRVRGLIKEHRVPGMYAISWNGADERGLAVAPGVYFYKLIVDGRSIGQRQIVIVHKSGP